MDMMNNETKTVALTCGGETREVEISRWVNEKGQTGVWHYTGSITARYRTGAKLHAVYHPQVFERDGKFFFSTVGHRNRHIIPVGWADKVVANAKW
jgi:hypothetical protein